MNDIHKFEPIPFVSLAMGLMLLSVAAPIQAADRPNILFILADDQSQHELKLYDPASPLETPVLDRLAADGMTIHGAYHMGSFSGAVCTPSRYMIMSGRSVWHLPNRPLMPPTQEERDRLCPPDLPEYTMAAVFNRAGYDTMRTCKVENSYGDANAKFAVSRLSTKRGGTDATGSAWHAEQVLNYLNQREAANDTDPFLIYLGFSHPHDPRHGKPELLAKYGADNDVVPATPSPASPALQPNYLPAHPFHHGHPGLRDEESVQGVGTRRDEPAIRNELGREYACSENIDIQVGRVLDKLEAMGELENTYVFYTADHGISIGRHGLLGKQNLYEHAWRVPFIVKGPGIPAGSHATGNIYLLDVLRTLCDLTGVEAPASTEGISFKPVLEADQDAVRDVLYGVYCGGTKPGMRCVKKGDWKLIKYDVLDGAVRETQLFNLAENPLELLMEHHDPAVIALTGNTPGANQVNLAHDPLYAEKRREMEALLMAEQQRLDDPYLLWDQVEPCDPVPEVCNNNKDDDCDGLIDCEDEDCAGHADCVREICGNGIDDDGDDLVDCEDPECIVDPACPQTHVTDGLVAFYTLDEADVDGDTVLDVAGGNHATIVGALSPTSGVIDEALDFDRTGSYIAIPPLGDFPRATVECWAQTRNLSYQFQGLVSTWGWMAGMVHLKFQDGTIRVGKQDGGRTWIGAVANRWYHIVYTTDTTANELKLYVDGVLAGQAEAGAAPEDMNERRIGSEYDFSRYLDGMVDEVRIYNRVLEPDEVLRNFAVRSNEVDPGGGSDFRRGDVNIDGKIDLADPVALLSYLFSDAAPPGCLDAADGNDDGSLNLADAISMLSHLFADAGPLPAPFGLCGEDPGAVAPDELDCASFPPCNDQR